MMMLILLKYCSKPAPKITEKRKRLEEATAAAAAANTKAKKLKIDSEEEFQDVDQVGTFHSAFCSVNLDIYINTYHLDETIQM